MKPNLIPRVKANCFVKTFTRVKDAVTGNVAYTGVGFQPTALLAICRESGGSGSHGQGNVASQFILARATSGAMYVYPGGILIATDAAANWQSGAIVSMDADGFTIGWTKGGLGADNDLDCSVICLR